MRMIRLLRLAAQAEGLRWRRMGRGYAIQAGLAAGAAVFGLLLLIMLHMAAFAWIARGRRWAKRRTRSGKRCGARCRTRPSKPRAR